MYMLTPAIIAPNVINEVEIDKIVSGFALLTK